MSRGKPYKLLRVVDSASTQPSAPAEGAFPGQERGQSEEQAQELDRDQDYDYDSDGDYDLGDDWLSEDEQLFSLLVDDIERESREARLLLAQQRRQQYCQSSREDEARNIEAVIPASPLHVLPALQHEAGADSGVEPGPPISSFSPSLKQQSLGRSITDIEDYYAADPFTSGAERPSAKSRCGRHGQPT
ncbi:hypothetical protein KEM54_003612, partial [Ascosphaera aggregata]